MTTLDDLEKLALNGAYHYTPDDILRLIACVRAADAMRAKCLIATRDDEDTPELDYDAARAALEGDK